MLSGSEKPLVHGGCEAFAVLICWLRHSKGKYGRCPIIRFMRYIIYVSINHNLILTQFSILVAYFGEPNKKKVALVKKWTPKIQRCFHPTIDPSPFRKSEAWNLSQVQSVSVGLGLGSLDIYHRSNSSTLDSVLKLYLYVLI